MTLGGLEPLTSEEGRLVPCCPRPPHWLGHWHSKLCLDGKWGYCNTFDLFESKSVRYCVLNWTSLLDWASYSTTKFVDVLKAERRLSQRQTDPPAPSLPWQHLSRISLHISQPGITSGISLEFTFVNSLCFWRRSWWQALWGQTWGSMIKRQENYQSD